jgi:hypothetical protein
MDATDGWIRTRRVFDLLDTITEFFINIKGLYAISLWQVRIALGQHLETQPILPQPG